MCEIEKCDFGIQLKTECHKLDYCRTKEIVKLSDLKEDIRETLLWRAGLLNYEGLFAICHHHQQFFGNAFERRCLYCCDIFGTHKRRTKGKKMITLSMAKELKNKGHDVIPGKSLCRQCVKKLMKSSMMVVDQTSQRVYMNMILRPQRKSSILVWKLLVSHL